MFANTNGTSKIVREANRIIANLQAEFGALIGSNPALQYAVA